MDLVLTSIKFPYQQKKQNSDFDVEKLQSLLLDHVINLLSVNSAVHPQVILTAHPSQMSVHNFHECQLTAASGPPEQSRVRPQTKILEQLENRVEIHEEAMAQLGVYLLVAEVALVEDYLKLQAAVGGQLLRHHIGVETEADRAQRKHVDEVAQDGGEVVDAGVEDQVRGIGVEEAKELEVELCKGEAVVAGAVEAVAQVGGVKVLGVVTVRKERLNNGRKQFFFRYY